MITTQTITALSELPKLHGYSMCYSKHGTLDEHIADYEKRRGYPPGTIYEFVQPGHGGQPPMTVWFLAGLQAT